MCDSGLDEVARLVFSLRVGIHPEMYARMNAHLLRFAWSVEGCRYRASGSCRRALDLSRLGERASGQ